MIIELNQTTSREISAALVRAKRGAGAAGQVLTLVIVTDDDHAARALEAAKASATAHPSRVIVVNYVDGDDSHLDATLQVGEDLPGELLQLTVHGALRDHADAILLPLLLPDSPVVAWWPNTSPHHLATDPVGRLADRRITDSSGAKDPQAALLIRARHHAPGDTDLSWTRLTRWRALLAAALDQTQTTVTAARVTAAPDNAPATLLAAWLSESLKLPVTVTSGEYVGVHEVCLTTPVGDIVLHRPTDSTAQYRVPGQPVRTVALKRRPLTDLLTEELGRMGPDQVFEAACRHLTRGMEQ
ncbi:MAG TPA: glucose-6-phosphate dehydrogenase assembly protein OpcA [Arachnia sp.]|nr:glucose-6-phosphate dehydrogenase assembly protein OpcA [Arachnia sp.]HMT87361.1 glucose-6-phosphate dehydrogenase assembly protein OpcA [Arachnia sp.]